MLIGSKISVGIPHGGAGCMARWPSVKSRDAGFGQSQAVVQITSFWFPSFFLVFSNTEVVVVNP